MLDTECEQDGYSGKVREELEIGKSKDNKEKNNKKENYQPFDTYHPENQKQEDKVKTHTDILSTPKTPIVMMSKADRMLVINLFIFTLPFMNIGPCISICHRAFF